MVSRHFISASHGRVFATRSSYFWECFRKGKRLDQTTLNSCFRILSLCAPYPKISIPPLHVAAALVRLCNLHKGNTLQWSIATTYVINVLLNKKCALPRTAIDAAVRHFGTFLKDTRRLPVLWHRCLLTLVQRYKCKTHHINYTFKLAVEPSLCFS